MRPSKQYFHKHFQNDILESMGKECGADISCAYFKNYSRFKSKIYLGVDINEKVLDNLPDQRDGFPELHVEICDILNLQIPDQYRIDFLVSTHTLSHLESDKRLEVVEGFVNVLQPGGSLLFNIGVHSSYVRELDKMLLGTFRSIKKIRYRNPISQWYESRKSDDSGMYQPASSFMNKIVEGILYKIEDLSLFSFAGNMLYYYCQDKSSNKDVK